MANFNGIIKKMTGTAGQITFKTVNWTPCFLSTSRRRDGKKSV